IVNYISDDGWLGIDSGTGGGSIPGSDRRTGTGIRESSTRPWAAREPTATAGEASRNPATALVPSHRSSRRLAVPLRSGPDEAVRKASRHLQ
ncbi:MAG: hypothetical protein ABEJ97_06490, partial [Halobellus sp.]